MAVDLADRKRTTPSLKSWLDAIATYEKAFRHWEDRSKKIIAKYRDEKRDEELKSVTRFNILWSNTQTLKNATFARLPKPDVSRRFRDNDPVGRVASLILERALDYEVQHYQDYRATLGACVLDRFLPGRGTAWVRYEPKFRAAELGQPEGGLQPTEDAETEEVLDYECVPCDYVDWRDFGHSVARTWEEVTRVWRRIYMTKAGLTKRFGEEKAKLVPMDASPYVDANDQKLKEDEDRALIYEGWDRDAKRAVWFSKGVKDFLDERADPLNLEEFFPAPRPMWATLTNDSLVPIPDFCLYQDQASELDTLATRIDGLIVALQIRGVYDSTIPALQRLFTEGENGELKPVKNWAAFAEKQGLKGAIDIVDIAPIAAALISAYQAFDQVKNQIYEITRISDIMRGFVDPDEKLGQSQLKTQYSNLGIKAYQDQVAVFATELLQLKAQVMCNKFDPDTLLKLSAADQLSQQDKKLVPQALQLLLGPLRPTPTGGFKRVEGGQQQNPLRSFRIEVAADSLIHLDEEQEKTSRMEFLQAQGVFFKEFIAPLLSAPPPITAALGPLTMEMWKFGTTAFKVGKNIEGAFDEAAERLKALAMQPQPQGVPPEELQKAQQELQKKAQELEAQEKDLFTRETAQQVKEIKFDADQQVFAEKVKVAGERLDLAAEKKAVEVDRRTDNEKKAKEDNDRAEKAATGSKDVVKELVTEGTRNLAKQVAEVAKENAETSKSISELRELVAAEKEVVRDPKTGKVAGVRIKRAKNA